MEGFYLENATTCSDPVDNCKIYNADNSGNCDSCDLGFIYLKLRNKKCSLLDTSKNCYEGYIDGGVTKCTSCLNDFKLVSDACEEKTIVKNLTNDDGSKCSEFMTD